MFLTTEVSKWNGMCEMTVILQFTGQNQQTKSSHGIL